MQTNQKGQKESWYGMESNVVKICEFLGVPVPGDDLIKVNVGAEKLLKMFDLGVLTRSNLENCSNWTPKLRVFLEFAKKCPESIFETYVVSPERNDCRFDIEGVRFNVSRLESAHLTLLKDHSWPDVEKIENGIVRWWWD